MTAGSPATAACANLIRDLRDKLERRRVAPLAIPTAPIREDGKGPAVAQADVDGRASDLTALLAGIKEVENFPSNIADPAEILSKIAEIRTQLGLVELQEAAS